MTYMFGARRSRPLQLLVASHWMNLLDIYIILRTKRPSSLPNSHLAKSQLSRIKTVSACSKAMQSPDTVSIIICIGSISRIEENTLTLS